MAAENDKHATSSPIVSGYEIVRQIGRGGMAKVYLARQTTLNRDVALKELSRFHASTPEMAERFLRESRLVGSLNHPNIVTVYEYFEEDGIPYIAMEYVTGGSLRPYVGHLTLAQLAGVMEGVLAGLAHAQGYGIVHRDLKPENLMVTGDGRVKIADFGIAKATQTVGVGSFLTLTGTTVGTPMYMAPEQALGHEIGAWTDLYSVGVMAWEHVVGEAPFRDTEAAVMILARHVNEQIPLAADLNPDIDPSVSDWIDRLLAKDPAERPSTPEAAWDDLEEVLIARLGPRWRREASLPPPGALADVPRARTAAPSEVHSAGVPKQTRDSEAAVPSVSRAEDVQRSVDESYFTFGRPLERAEPALAVAPPEPVADAMPSISEKQVTDPGLDPDGTDDMPSIMASVPAPPPAPPAPLGPPAPPVAPAERVPPVSAASAVSPVPPSGRASKRPRGKAAAGVPLTARAAALAAVTLIAAAIGGFFLARSSGNAPSRTASLVHRVSSGPFSVALPAGWTSAGADSAPRLILSNEIVLTRQQPAGGALVIGTARTTDQSLLPPSLRAASPGAPPQQTVVLGGTDFYRYLSLTPAGASVPEAVYAVPTTAGTVIGACVLQGAAAGLLSGCERVLASLRVSRGHTLGLGPSPDLAAGLTKTIGALNVMLISAGQRLRSASGPRAQARAAGALAAAYGHAAASVRRLGGVSRDTNATAALAGALGRLSARYSALGRAARRGDRRAYDAARGAIESGASSVTAALGRFVKLGYTVG